MKSLFPAIKLQIPSSAFTTAYRRVRADPRVGPALDDSVIPALEQAAEPEERLAAFERQRLAAIGRYYRAVGARGEEYLTASERESRATGPGPHAALDAFDQVAFDLLDTWFMTLGRHILHARTSAAQRDDALARLEALANGSTPWKPALASNIVLGLVLMRTALKRGETL